MPLILPQNYGPAPYSPIIELTCSINGSNAIVVANQDTYSVTQNDQQAYNTSITPNGIYYSIFNKNNRNKITVFISRVDGHIVSTVTLGDARPGDKPVRLEGTCRRITERAF